jgi:predicted permease
LSNDPRSILASLVRSWRSLKRRPGFLVIAVSSLAIALGLATTVIAQIDSLMNPYTPIRDVARAFDVRVYGVGPRGGPTRVEAQEALRATGVFDTLVPVQHGRGMFEIGPALITGNMTFADAEYFTALGVRARLGRLFLPGETAQSGVAVVGDRFWRKYFGNSTDLSTGTFSFNGQAYRIVGVLDAGWNEGNEGDRSGGDDSYVWTPLRGGPPPAGPYADPSSFGRLMTAPATAGPYVERSYIGRLKPGIELRNAYEIFRSVRARWKEQYGESHEPLSVYMRSFKPDPLRIGTFHRALVAAAFFILVIASANVSALTLARGVANRRDQALRLALGAGRTDLLRDVAAEVTILAVIGGLLGVTIAYASMGVMTALTPPELAWLGFGTPHWNPRVFAGLFAAVALCIALSAIGPALYVTRIAPAEPLKDSSGTTTGRTRSRFKMLVVGELALAMVLLFGASLISKTAQRVAVFDFGYEARHLAQITASVVATPHLHPSLSPGIPRRIMPEILTSDLGVIAERLRGLPDVRDAAWFAHDAPEHQVVISDATAALDSVAYLPQMFNVGPGFFRTLGIPILEGRDFVEGDMAGEGHVILDERTAQRLFPDGSAIGRRVKLGDLKSQAQWVPVIGIARNVIHEVPAFPELEPSSVVYTSREGTWGIPSPKFVVRAGRDIRDVAPLATRLVRDLVPPRSSVVSSKWSTYYDALLAGRRFTAGIFATLSLASLLLATAGLFGVLSYAVNQRMREFALRVALGAQRAHVLRLVFRDSFVMALGGTAIGAFAGLYAGFELWDWLWGVYPVDATALIIAELVLLAVTAAAAALPALRAARANPAEVMRAI